MSKEIEYRVTEAEELEKKGIELLPVQEINPGILKPNKDNKIFNPLPEKEYKRLKEDIAERGIIDPLIIRKDNTLFTGHNRLKIALELGLKTIPVRKVVSSLNPKEERKLLVLDNLLRRQLSPAEKESLILEFYKEEILKDNRGGDRKSLKNEEGKIKSSTEPLNLAQKIENETGINKGTAKRILSDIRKKLKPTKPEIKSSTEPLIEEESKLRPIALKKFDKKEKLSHPEKKVLKTFFTEEIKRREKEISELRKEITEYKKKLGKVK